MPPDDVDQIEAVAYDAWPASEVETVDGWVMRYGDGFSRRLNSVTVSSDAATDRIVDRVTQAGAWLCAHGVSLVVRVTSASPPAVDEHLTRLRFSIEGETVVMTGPVVPAAPRDESPEPALVGSSAPSPAWRAVQQRWMGIDDPEAWDRVLARVASPALFAEARDGDGLVAAGLGVVRRGWLGIFEVATDPEHRRRGHGTRLVQGLMAWATTAGATRVFLQVVASNEAATGLYRGLGFVEAYRYWYRRPAPESRSTMRPSPAASG